MKLKGLLFIVAVVFSIVYIMNQPSGVGKVPVSCTVEPENSECVCFEGVKTRIIKCVDSATYDTCQDVISYECR